MYRVMMSSLTDADDVLYLEAGRRIWSWKIELAGSWDEHTAQGYADRAAEEDPTGEYEYTIEEC